MRNPSACKPAEVDRSDGSRAEPFTSARDPSSAAVRDGVDDCFDRALATSPTRRLPIAAVIDVLHVTHAPERIALYRSAMQRGERFPPIAVVRILGRFFIADGHKRFTAYRALPVTQILVEVWTLRRWGRDQWRQFSCKTRQQWHALSRSLVDPQAREQATRLFWDTVAHWKRIGRSLRQRRTT